jgi:hypothetical protein
MEPPQLRLGDPSVEEVWINEAALVIRSYGRQCEPTYRLDVNERVDASTAHLVAHFRIQRVDSGPTLRQIGAAHVQLPGGSELHGSMPHALTYALAPNVGSWTLPFLCFPPSPTGAEVPLRGLPEGPPSMPGHWRANPGSCVPAATSR